MQRFARIKNGVVTEIMNVVDGTDLADLFHPDIVAQCRPSAPEVVQGWMLEGDELVAPPAPTLSEAQLRAYAADARWRREVGGILVGTVPVATDDRSKTMVLGARVAAAANPAWETVWHGADGQTYPLNAAAMIAISDAVEAHVNATFATFAIVKADIEAGEITTLAEIDAAFA